MLIIPPPKTRNLRKPTKQDAVAPPPAPPTALNLVSAQYQINPVTAVLLNRFRYVRVSAFFN